MKRKEFKHGDPGMYQYRGCRCAICREGIREYQRGLNKSRAKPKPVTDAPVAHGSISTAHLRDWA